MVKEVAVIGAGSWGTALALVLASKGLRVKLWVHGEDTYQKIVSLRENAIYLPGIKLPENIEASQSLKGVVANQNFLIIVVPSHVFRLVLSQIKDDLCPGSIIVSATKGIEEDSLLTMSGVVADVLKGINYKYVVLSGPSFAKEVAARLPTAVTAASLNIEAACLVQQTFSVPWFRVYTHQDVLGVELGGALKNVMAIAAGIADGLGLGDNARAALITRSLVEMIRLGRSLGAKQQTFAGLSGLGDLVLTATSRLSRNYSVGLRLGQGERISDVLASMRMVAEGVRTTKAAYKLACHYQVEMPIVEKVYEIIYQGKSPDVGLKELLSRSLKPEFW